MELLTLEQAAQILHVTYNRAAELAREGIIPVVRLGRQIRVDPEELLGFHFAGRQGMARRLATFAGRISYGIKLQRPPVARWAHKSKGKHLDNQSVTQPTNEVNENLTPNEPFPLEVFPETIRAFVEAVARSIGCPIDFVAVAVLVACACSIGAARVLKIKEGWLEFSNLYVAIVGEQGSGKSPAMEAALYRRRNGERAVPIHLTTDATMEALVLALRENVRHGVLYVADSLVGLFQALNKYRNGKGNDREFLEVLWGGSEATTWRTMQDSGRRQLDSIEVHRPWFSILGTTQPEALTRIRSTSGADGLLERFLFTFPPVERGEYSERGLDPAIHGDYWKVLDSLYGLHEGYGENEVVEMSPQAAEAWSEYARWHATQTISQPDYLRGAWIKLLPYTARFALTLQLVHRAAGQTTTQDIEAATVHRAAKLTKYFASQADRAHRRMRGDDSEARLMRLVSWLQRHGGKATVREVLAGRVAGLTSITDVMTAFHKMRRMGVGRFLAGSGRGDSSIGFELTPEGSAGNDATAEFAESSADRSNGE